MSWVILRRGDSGEEPTIAPSPGRRARWDPEVLEGHLKSILGDLNVQSAWAFIYVPNVGDAQAALSDLKSAFKTAWENRTRVTDQPRWDGPKYFPSSTETTDNPSFAGLHIWRKPRGL